MGMHDRRRRDEAASYGEALRALARIRDRHDDRPRVVEAALAPVEVLHRHTAAPVISLAAYRANREAKQRLAAMGITVEGSGAVTGA